MNSMPELPRECWELIANSLPHDRYLEPLSLVSSRFLSITNHLRKSLTISSPCFPAQLLRRFPNLKHIAIKVRQEVPSFDLDSVLTQIADSDIDLQSLDISRQGGFPLKGIARLGLKMKNLRKLDCSFIDSLDDHHLFVIGSSFPLLDDLSIAYPNSSSGHVTDDGIIELASKLKALRKIDVSGNHFVRDQSLLELSSNCLLLSQLVARDCNFITSEGIGFALRNCVGLSSISVDQNGFPARNSFCSARNLSKIALSAMSIPDDWLFILAEACLPLTQLSISTCFNFTFNGVYKLLHSYQDLVFLSLEGSSFLTDECMIKLSKFVTKLARIELSMCYNLTGLTIATLINNCSLLKEIVMYLSDVGAEDLGTGFVVGNSRIELLTLAGSGNLSDESIKNIVLWCPNLHELNISFCPAVSEDGVMEVLRNCCKLEHLEICQCMGIKNLEIGFDLPNLEFLQVGGPMINNKAVGMIARRCSGLFYLCLDGCLNVTMEGLNQVAQKCRRLRKLDLRNCDNIEAEGIIPLVLSMPSLRKIIPPQGFVPTEGQKDFLLRHGCLVCKA